MGSARRIGLGVAAVVAGIALTLPGSAAGGVTFGSDLEDDVLPGALLVSEVTVLQRQIDQDDAAPGGLRAPSNGVITGWRVKKGPTPATLALRVVRGNTSVYQGQPTVFPTPAGTFRFEARARVRAGDAIGIDQLTGAEVQMLSLGGALVAWSPLLGPTETRASNLQDAIQLLLNADLEPDCDNDGFGDETQDQSIESCNPPDTQAPSVEITKGAPNKLRKSKVKFKFTSDDPTATFECKADRKPYKPCSSPKKLKRLDEGKHKFKVRATDPAGNVGAPVRDRFRVV
jgi:hypothetical protein